MNDKSWRIVFALCGGGIGYLIASGVALLIFSSNMRWLANHWQSECVSRGAAEWLVDDNGTTEFKWLLEPEEKP